MEQRGSIRGRAASMRRKVIGGAVALATVATLVAGGAAAPVRATGMPQGWYDGNVQYTTVTNCFSIISGSPYTEHGVSTFVGYYAYPDAYLPAVNNLYYVRVVGYGLGSPCANQYFYPELLLPANTSLAIDGANPIYCFASTDGGSHWGKDTANCPTTLTANGTHGGYPIPSKDASIANTWPLAAGVVWDLRVPVRTSPAISNSNLSAYVKVIDGEGSPTLFVQEPVYVYSQAAAVPWVSYPAVPTVNITTSTATTMSTVYTGAGSGIACVDIGFTTAYGTTTPIALAQGTWNLQQPWSGMSAGTTVHWRTRFKIAAASCADATGWVYGADQTFRTLSVPDAPTGAKGTGQGSSAVITWTPPGQTGGTTLTGFTATVSPGGKQCTSAIDFTCTVTGLADGLYSVSVTAANAQGTSAASAASAQFRVDATPPTGGTVSLGSCSGTGVLCAGTKVTIGSPAVSNGSTFTATYTGIVEAGSGVASVSCAAVGGYTAVAGGAGVNRTCAYTRNAAALDAGGSKTTTAKDVAGNTGNLPAFTLARETTPPTTTTPDMAFRTGQTVTATSVPVTVSWPAATDAGVGVARYEVAKTTNGGTTWTSLATAVTGTSFSTSVAPSGTVAFRVRAVDAVGNPAAWTQGVVLRPRLISEAAATYAGAWTSITSASNLGGTAKSTTATNASATFRVTGRSVGLIATVGSGRGSVAIYLDGAATPVATVSTAAASTAYGRLIWQKAWTSTAAHTIKVVAVSASPVEVDGLVVGFTDTTAPTVSTGPSTGPRSGAAVSATALPVSVSWTAADNAGGSGIARYELAKSTDGGTVWANVSSALTSTSFATAVAPSGTVRYRVRAVDWAGNASAWATGPVLTPALSETSSGVTVTGTWATASGTSYSGGSTRYNGTAGNSMSITFTGRAVAIVSTKAASRGAFKVYLDGVLASTVDTLAASTAYRVQVFAKDWGSSAAHTVKVVVVGTAGRSRVDLDAFVILR